MPLKIMFVFILFYFHNRTINDGSYWSKSLEFALEMLSLPNEELISLHKSATLKHSDSPNFTYIIQV